MIKKIFLCIGLIASLLFMAGTVWLGFYAKQNGIVYLKTDGDPKMTVRLFYDAVLIQDYDEAYGYLLDYRTLGFAPETGGNALPEDLPADCLDMFREALLDSYSYELEGEPEIKDLKAWQKVKFTCFDLEPFCQEINARFYRTLEEDVQSRPKSEMFDTDGNYRVDVLEKIYEEVLREVMRDGAKRDGTAQDEAARDGAELRGSTSGQYLRNYEYTVELSYQNKEWKILVNDEMTEGFVGR